MCCSANVLVTLRLLRGPGNPVTPNASLSSSQRSGENVYKDILGQGDFRYLEADIGLSVHLKPRNWSSG